MQVLPNLCAQQSDEETKSSFDVSLCLEPPSLQAELNRFKEIQKNPQLLLQTLSQMENQKQRQVEDLGLPIDKNEHEAIEIVANKNRNESDSLVCYICGNLLRRGSMYAHLKGHNGCTYACTIDQCNSVYKSKQSLTKHQLVHHLKRTRNSGKDGRPWKRRISSADQVENGKKSHICAVCGKCLLSKSAVSEHMRTHTGEKPERCRLCYRTFRQKSALRNHTRTCLHAATFSVGPK